MPRAVVAQADMPRWSPLGDWIVFNADTTLYRIQPNGVGRTRVGPIRFYHPRADWSPDGLWLIARTRTNLELINVATAETLPLGWSSRFIRPAWKR
jgi:Tol biopolymer transport system component